MRYFGIASIFICLQFICLFSSGAHFEQSAFAQDAISDTEDLIDATSDQPAAAQQKKPDSELEASLIASLQRAYSILSNPETERPLKSEAITVLMQQVSASCQANCLVPIQVLKQFNDAVHSPSVTQLLDLAKPYLPNQSIVTAEGVVAGSVRIQNALEKMDPTVLKHRINATTELLRYLIALEEDSLFSITENPANLSKVKQELEQTVGEQGSQLKAMFKIAKILANKFTQLQTLPEYQSKINDLKSEDKKAAQEVAGANQEEIDNLKSEMSLKFGGLKLTAAETREIAEAVSEMNLIVFSKFIQMISNNSILFGDEARQHFKAFQDNLPKIPADVVNEIIRSDLGKDPSEIFIDFDAANPIASATVGQTYKAKVRTSTGRLKPVIIKVQRPNLDSALNRNRVVDQVLIRLAKIGVGSESGSSIVDLLASQLVGFEDTIEHEFNYPAEFRQLQEANALLKFQSGISVPKPIGRYSGNRVLTMDVLEGQNVDTVLEEQKKLEASVEKMSEKSLERLYSRILDTYLYQSVILGQMHGDLHPGNVLATDQGAVGLIDWSHIFQSRGLVSQPMRLIYYLFAGNAQKFAEFYAKLGRNPKFSAADFAVRVQEVFEQKKIAKRSLSDIVMSRSKASSQLSPEEIFSALPTLIKISQEMGFEVSPKYFQFIRTSLPVFSTLAAIGKQLPANRKKKIIAMRILMMAPKGAVQYTFGHAWNAATLPAREIARKINEIGRNRNLREKDRQDALQAKPSVPQCRLIFSHARG